MKEKSTNELDEMLKNMKIDELENYYKENHDNTALKLYDMKPLYAKDKRDACIIVAINNRKYDLGDIDEILEKQNLTKLSKDI